LLGHVVIWRRKIMKVALYARVSSERQDVNLSISSQLKALREYAWKNGYSIVQEFVDEAESGRSASQEVERAFSRRQIAGIIIT